MTRLSIFLSDLIKGQNTLRYLNRFERLRDASRSETEAYRLARLKQLLVHCERDVPFTVRDSGSAASLQRISLHWNR